MKQNKLLCLLSACLMLVSLIGFPASAAEGDEHTVYTSNATFVRGDGANADAFKASPPLNYLQLDSRKPNSPHRMTFIWFDLDNIKAYLETARELKLRLAVASDKNPGVLPDASAQFAVYLLPQELEGADTSKTEVVNGVTQYTGWEPKTVRQTYNNAKDFGLIDYQDPDSLCYTSPTSLQLQTYETGDILDKIKNHLDQNPDDTTVAFKIAGIAGADILLAGPDMDDSSKPALILTEGSDERDPAELVQQTMDELTFSSISSEEAEGITEDLALPKFGVGATTITWSTTNPEIVDVLTGKISRPAEKTKVSLTATAANGSASASKTFTFNVLGETVVFATDATFVRKDQGDNIMVTGLGDSLQVDKPGGTERQTYLRINLAEYKELLADASSVRLRIVAKKLATDADQFVVYQLPQSMSTWSRATLTFNTAAEAGMTSYSEEENKLFTSPAAMQAGTAYYSENILPLLQEYFSENPEEIAVNYKIAGVNGGGFEIYGVGATAMYKPALMITRKIFDVDREYDALTIDNAGYVKEDLELPTEGAFGAAISWETSDPSIISADGHVTRPNLAGGAADEPIVTLTATIRKEGRELQKVFQIRVVPNGVLDASEDTYIEEGGAAGDSFADADAILTDSGGTDITHKVGFLKFPLAEAADRLRSTKRIELVLSTKATGNEKTMVVTPLADAALKNASAAGMTYQNSADFLNATSRLSARATADESGRVVFDVTESVREIGDGIAAFKLEVEDGAITVDSSEVFARGPRLVVSQEDFTSEYAVDYVTENLNFRRLTNQQAQFVTENLTLPITGAFDTTIEWSSSKPEVINETGVVSLPANDTVVTLTATVRHGQEAAVKTFEVTVLRNRTDAEFVALEAENIEAPYSILTGPVTLPVTGLFDGAAIKWETEDDHVIQISGKNLSLKRILDNELTTTLKATVTFGTATAVREFPVTVIRDSKLDLMKYRDISGGGNDVENIVDNNIATVWTGGSGAETVVDLGNNRSINEFLFVPAQAVNSYKISVSYDSYQWKEVINGSGLIADVINYVRPEQTVSGRYVKLEFPGGASLRLAGAYSTATGGGSGQPEDVGLPETVTGNFTLPQTIGGVSVVWDSLNPEYIAVSGYDAIVTRPESSVGDVRVTLRATAKNGGGQTYYYITVKKKNGSNGGGGGGGGTSGNSGSNTSIGVPTVPQPTTQPSGPSFSDLHEAAWAEEYIETLYQNGVVDGVGDGRFEPNRSLSREEMVKLLVTSFALEGDGPAPGFTDVSETDWSYRYISTAKSLGIVGGISDDQFGKDGAITRQDAACMLARTLDVAGVTAEAGGAAFSDEADIADYAAESVKKLAGLGIIGGDEEGNFLPQKAVTRAEMSKMLCLALKAAGK